MRFLLTIIDYHELQAWYRRDRPPLPTPGDNLFGDVVDECKLLLFILEFPSRPPKSGPRKRQAQRRLTLEPAGKRKVTGERTAVAEVAKEAHHTDAAWVRGKPISCACVRKWGSFSATQCLCGKAIVCQQNWPITFRMSCLTRIQKGSTAPGTSSTSWPVLNQSKTNRRAIGKTVLH